MAITGAIGINLGITNTPTDPLSSSVEKLSGYSFTLGTDELTTVWHDQRTLAASATEDLDLSGSLTDTFGNSVALTSVRMLIVKADDGNTNDVLVGGAAANQFINWVSNSSDVVVVKPGGILLLFAPTASGYAVTAGTGDLLKIANSAGTTGVTYDIYVGGIST